MSIRRQALPVRFQIHPRLTDSAAIKAFVPPLEPHPPKIDKLTPNPELAFQYPQLTENQIDGDTTLDQLDSICDMRRDAGLCWDLKALDPHPTCS